MKIEKQREAMPDGAVPYDMTNFHPIDPQSGRKTAWRLYGYDGQATSIGYFAISNRAAYDKPFGMGPVVLNRDTRVPKLHDQYTQNTSLRSARVVQSFATSCSSWINPRKLQSDVCSTAV